MKNNIINDAKTDVIPAAIEEQPIPQEQAIDVLLEAVEALDDENNEPKAETELTIKTIEEMELAKADATREDGSSLPLVNISYGSEGIVNSLARDLGLNSAPLPLVEVKLLPPLPVATLVAPIARPYDGEIHELFLDSREFNTEQFFLTIQSNLLATPLPYPDASIEKFNSPEGPIESPEPIAIYGNYIEGYTSPGAGASSVNIVSMTFNNQVYTPDASGKIIVTTNDGQLVMYTNEVGLNQDFAGNGFKPGFFYYVEFSNENHAPGNGENLFDHNMSITIANNLGQTATGAFNIHIIDDVPIAHDDTVKLLQDLGLEGDNQLAALDSNSRLPVNQVSGNLLSNDDFSVDVQNTVKQVTFTFDGASYVVALSNGSNIIQTDFGSLTIDKQGNYTYKITAELPNDHITEDHIQYQIVDNDGDTSTAELLLRMAPAPVVTIVPNEGQANDDGGLTVTEGTDTSVQYKVVVTGVLLEDLSFTAATHDDTAFANGNTPGTPDYTASSTVFTVPADDNALHEIVLPPNTIVDDNVFENSPENFNTVIVPSGTISSSSNTSIPTTILDDDPAPKVSIDSTLTVTEGNPGDPIHYATLTITMTGSSQDPVTFHYQTEDGSALGGTVPGVGNPDYVPISGDITFGPSFNGTQTATIKVPIIDDYTYERLVNQQETFKINLTPVDMNGAVFGTSTSVVTIKDDDIAPYVKIVGGTISEDGGSFDAKVELYGSSAENISFAFTTSNGTAVFNAGGAGQPDYISTTSTITFLPMAATAEGAKSQTFHVSIPILNDTTHEPTESFTISITPQGYVAGPPASLDLASSTLSATVTITDNDAAPTLSVGSISISEAASVAHVTITRIGGTTEAISFKLSTVDISAVAGSDYTALNPNAIYTIPAGNGNASVSVDIPIINDGITEPSENFAVNITQVTAGTVSSTTNGTVTILNDDIAAQAVNDTKIIDPSGFASYNVTFVLDTSSSMGTTTGPNGTRLEVLKQALNGTGNLLDTYYALSNALHVNLIKFNSNADFVSQKQVNDTNDLGDVKSDINGLTSGGTTNYEAALDKAIARFIIDNGNGYSSLDGYTNRVYFISDGEPNSGQAGNIAAWQAALAAYGVESFTANISAGTASNTYLDPIATQSHNPLTFVAANDLSNLDDYLLSTVAITGNVLANDAPGSSGAASVISYLYDNGTQVGTIGNVVTTALGGKFVLYADGTYNYIPDGNYATPENEIFHYTIQDPGGNQSSANLTLSLLAYASPVVLDLNHDGNIELISVANSSVSFDVNHDGAKEQLGWVSPHEGILVYDPNNSGQVTDINQISFTSYVAGAKTDLEGLRFFDSNHDGKLDANDRDYSHFGVWQDGNSNGIVDAGEYQILSQAGIASISLISDHNKESNSGNMITGYTSYQTNDGQTHLAADVSLSVGASMPIHSAADSIHANDILPSSNALDFSSLPQSNSQTPQVVAPLQAIDAAPAAVVAMQADASVTAVLQQAQHETVAL